MGGEFEIFIKVLMGIAAAIVAIGGAVGVIEHVAERVSMKTNRVAQQVDDHEKELSLYTSYIWGFENSTGENSKFEIDNYCG